MSSYSWSTCCWIPAGSSPDFPPFLHTFPFFGGKESPNFLAISVETAPERNFLWWCAISVWVVVWTTWASVSSSQSTPMNWQSNAHTQHGLQASRQKRIVVYHCHDDAPTITEGHLDCSQLLATLIHIFFAKGKGLVVWLGSLCHALTGMFIWEHLSILYKAVDPSSLRNKRIL